MNHREAAVYRYLREHQLDHVPPTYHLIGSGSGISSSQAHRILHRLAEDGYLEKDKRPGRRVVWRITDKVPPGFQDEATVTWWCVETNNLKHPGQRVFQPLTLSFSRKSAPRLALEMLADPSREAKWKRVRVKIEEVRDAQ
jgi:hypothetical protein